MAWNLKYQLQYEDFKGNQMICNFLIEDYPGEVVELEGYGIDCVRYDKPSREIFTHVVMQGSSCEFDIVEYVDNTYDDLSTKDRASWVKIYRESGDLFWQGWTVAGNYVTNYNIGPKKVTFTAIDGIGFLKAKELDVAGLAIGIGGRRTITYMRDFIKAATDYIAFGCDIYESLDVYPSEAARDDPVWSETYLDTYNYYNEDDAKHEDLYTVLEKILFPYGARFYQLNGDWYIDRIDQLKKAENIKFNRFNSSYVYQSQVDEDRTVTITGADGDPLVVPVDMSLKRELMRPFSLFTINIDYNLRKNLLRKIHDDDSYTVTGGGYFNHFFDDDNDTLTISEMGFAPNQLQGLWYGLGFIDLSEGSTSLGSGYNRLEINISGTMRGYFTARLLLQTYDLKLYWYAGHNLQGGPENCWIELTSYPVGWQSRGAIFVANPDVGADGTSFNETMSVTSIVDEESGTLEGNLYLILCPPWTTAEGYAWVVINTASLAVDLLQYNKSEADTGFAMEDVTTNEKEVDLNVYSYGGGTNNAGLVYPGALFKHMDTGYITDHFEPYGNFTVVSFDDLDGDGKPDPIYTIGGLSEVIRQSVLNIYSEVKWKLTGTICTDLINIGSIVKYKGKVYMVVALNYNMRRCYADVTLLQIGVTEEYIEVESESGFLIAESSAGSAGPIPVE